MDAECIIHMFITAELKPSGFLFTFMPIIFERFHLTALNYMYVYLYIMQMPIKL